MYCFITTCPSECCRHGSDETVGLRYTFKQMAHYLLIQTVAVVFFNFAFFRHLKPVILHKTRNSSGDEIANVNFLYDDIVHVLHKFRHRSTRLCVVTHVFTRFSETTQYNGHYVGQGHSSSPILVPIESSYTTSY